jgi:hypothetical protein
VPDSKTFTGNGQERTGTAYAQCSQLGINNITGANPPVLSAHEDSTEQLASTGWGSERSSRPRPEKRSCAFSKQVLRRGGKHCEGGREGGLAARDYRQ